MPSFQGTGNRVTQSSSGSRTRFQLVVWCKSCISSPTPVQVRRRPNLLLLCPTADVVVLQSPFNIFAGSSAQRCAGFAKMSVHDALAQIAQLTAHVAELESRSLEHDAELSNRAQQGQPQSVRSCKAHRDLAQASFRTLSCGVARRLLPIRLEGRLGRTYSHFRSQAMRQSSKRQTEATCILAFNESPARYWVSGAFWGAQRA